MNNTENMLDNTFKANRSWSNVQILVGLRYLQYEVPIPSFDEDTLEFRASVKRWHEIWNLNDAGFTLLGAIPLKNKVRPQPFEYDVPITLNDHNIKQVGYEIKDEMLHGKRVRTPVAHFLEDFAYLEWAFNTGLPVFAYSNEVNRYVDSNYNDIGEVFLASLEFFKIYERPQYRTTRWDGWLFHMVLGLNTRGKLPSKNKNSINAGSNFSFDKIVKKEISDSDIKFGIPLFEVVSLPEDIQSDEYYNWDLFKNNSGRKFHVVSIHNLQKELLRYYSCGEKGVFIKSTIAKHGLCNFTFPDTKKENVTSGYLMGKLLDLKDSDFILRTPYDFLSSTIDRYHFQRFIVQGQVQFTDEYRFFIVGKELICGTPVRRSDTILASKYSNVREGRFRPFMCSDREADGPRHDRNKTAKYVKVAQKLLKQFPIESSEDCVLDIGSDEHGNIIPIEINTMRRAGLYGCHPKRSLDALLSKL